jgi:hypothetical protein
VQPSLPRLWSCPANVITQTSCGETVNEKRHGAPAENHQEEVNDLVQCMISTRWTGEGDLDHGAMGGPLCIPPLKLVSVALSNERRVLSVSMHPQFRFPLPTNAGVNMAVCGGCQRCEGRRLISPRVGSRREIVSPSPFWMIHTTSIWHLSRRPDLLRQRRGLGQYVLHFLSLRVIFIRLCAPCTEEVVKVVPFNSL